MHPFPASVIVDPNIEMKSLSGWSLENQEHQGLPENPRWLYIFMVLNHQDLEVGLLLQNDLVYLDKYTGFQQNTWTN